MQNSFTYRQYYFDGGQKSSLHSHLSDLGFKPTSDLCKLCKERQEFTQNSKFEYTPQIISFITIHLLHILGIV